MKRHWTTLPRLPRAERAPCAEGRPGDGLGGVYGRAASIGTGRAPSPVRGGVSALAPPRSRLSDGDGTAAPPRDPSGCSRPTERQHFGACLPVSVACAAQGALDLPHGFLSVSTGDWGGPSPPPSWAPTATPCHPSLRGAAQDCSEISHRLAPGRGGWRPAEHPVRNAA